MKHHGKNTEDFVWVVSLCPIDFLLSLKNEALKKVSRKRKDRKFGK